VPKITTLSYSWWLIKAVEVEAPTMARTRPPTLTR